MKEYSFAQKGTCPHHLATPRLTFSVSGMQDKTAQTLEQIAVEARKCTACHLHKGRTIGVPGEGNPHADIMFIGEGPGKTENETGRPFVGAAGKLLEQLLASIGLSREDVFIGNVVKCRPPGNRDPLPMEIETCTKLWLFRQITLIKPQVIVTLGRHSMYLFLPENFRISHVHGQPYRRNGQTFLPLYHPAAALYNSDLKATLRKDFQRIPLILKKMQREE